MNIVRGESDIGIFQGTSFIHHCLRDASLSYEEVLANAKEEIEAYSSKYKSSVFAFGDASSGYRAKLDRFYSSNSPSTEITKKLEKDLKEYCKSIGVEVLEKSGQEDLDICNAYVTQVKKLGKTVDIISSRRVLASLVDEKVSFQSLNTKKKISISNFDKETGFSSPKQLIETLYLSGEYPYTRGFQGIGVAYGQRLIKQYKSMDKVIDNIENIAIKDSRIATLLKKGSTYSSFHKKMSDFGSNKELDLFLSQKIEKVAIKENINSKQIKVVSDSYPRLRDLEIELKNSSTWTLSAVRNSADDIVGLGLSMKNGGRYYVPIAHDDYLNTDKSELIQILNKAMKAYDKELIFHGLQDGIHDLLKLSKDSEETIKMRGAAYHCTEMGHLITKSENKDLISMMKDIGFDKEDLINSRVSRKSNEMHPDSMAQLVSNQLASIEYLREQQAPQISSNRSLYSLYNDLIKAIPVAVEMELRGIPVDEKYIREKTDRLEKNSSKNRDLAVNEISRKWSEEDGELNINSNDHLRKYFFEKLKLKPVAYTQKGSPALDNEALLKMKEKYPNTSELIDNLISYRKKTKDLSVFKNLIGRLRQDGTIAIRFKIGGAVTLRSTGDCHQWKKDLYVNFIKPPAGYEAKEFDFKNQELAILAVVSGDKNMQKAFKENLDLHTYTASLIFNKKMDEVSKDERQSAKTINFTISYGGGAGKISNDLKISKQEAQRLKAKWLESFPDVAKLHKNIEKEVRLTKGVVTSSGYFRPCTSVMQGYNAHMQVAAAVVLLKMLPKARHYLKKYSSLPETKGVTCFNGVHDSLHFFLRSGNEDLSRKMSGGIMNLMKGLMNYKEIEGFNSVTGETLVNKTGKGERDHDTKGLNLSSSEKKVLENGDIIYQNGDNKEVFRNGKLIKQENLEEGLVSNYKENGSLHGPQYDSTVMKDSSGKALFSISVKTIYENGIEISSKERKSKSKTRNI